MTRRPARPLAAVVVTLVLAGCGIQDEDRPRPIGPEDGASELVTDSPEAQTETGTSLKIYLLVAQTPSQTSRLRAVTRDLTPSPTSLFMALTEGLTAAEQTDRLRTAVPTETVLLNTPTANDGVLALDVNEAIFEATGSDLVDALAQIVFTMSELPAVRSVQLRVNGQAQEWPTGDGSLTGRPLRVFDYPERNPTSQPDYPAAAPAPAPTTTG